MTNTLLQTIESDLSAGVSYLETEAEATGLFLWNTFKGVFVALEPAEAAILTTILGNAVTQAGTGASIEDIETSALNTAKADEQTVLLKAGSGVVQTVIAGIKANTPTS